jgi:UDP-N-acetylmuramoyl-tripeptide--D-alanyl-D-alanine ligase
MGIRIKDIPVYSGATLYGADSLPVKIARFVTDSRKLNAGDIFIAIKGESHDAHSFIDKVLVSKAALIIVNKSWHDTNKNIKGKFAVVDDTVKAMLRMAEYHLKELKIPVIAITGSNGKTTTRALTAAVLSARYKVLSTQGNFNNRIGLPLTVFNIGKQHQLAVLEMGTNHFGEISELSLCAHPETAVITNIGRSHLEFLHNRKGVLRAKMEIQDGMKTNGTLIVNGDDDLLAEYSTKKAVSVKRAGFNNGDFLRGKCFSTSLLSGSEFTVGKTKVRLAIPGAGAATDALLALAVGKHYGVSIEVGAAQLRKIKAPENRMETAKVNGVTIVIDCYNANPDSVSNVIYLLGVDSTFNRKIAVLGTMAELGKSSKTFHHEIGKRAAESGVDVLLTIGDGGALIAEGAKKAGLTNTFTFKKAEDATPVIRASLKKGDVLLIKGSHSMHLENIFKELIKGKGR